jgi:hypothetical protein
MDSDGVPAQNDPTLDMSPDALAIGGVEGDVDRVSADADEGAIGGVEGGLDGDEEGLDSTELAIGGAQSDVGVLAAGGEDQGLNGLAIGGVDRVAAVSAPAPAPAPEPAYDLEPGSELELELELDLEPQPQPQPELQPEPGTLPAGMGSGSNIQQLRGRPNEYEVNEQKVKRELLHEVPALFEERRKEARVPRMMCPGDRMLGVADPNAEQLWPVRHWRMAMDALGIALSPALPHTQVYLGTWTRDEDSESVAVAVKAVSLETLKTAACVDYQVLTLVSQLVTTGHSEFFPILYGAIIATDDNRQTCVYLIMEKFEMTLQRYVEQCVLDKNWDALYDAMMESVVALCHGWDKLQLVHNDMSMANFMVNSRDPVQMFVTTPSSTMLEVRAWCRVALLDFGRASARALGLVGTAGGGAGSGAGGGGGRGGSAGAGAGSGSGLSMDDEDVTDTDGYMGRDVEDFARQFRAILPPEWFQAWEQAVARAGPNRSPRHVPGIPDAVVPMVGLLSDQAAISNRVMRLFDERLIQRYLRVGPPVPPVAPVVTTLPPSSK